MEQILTETKDSLTLTIRYPYLWNLYKIQVANFWTTEEIDLSSDIKDLVNLSPGEKNVLFHVLSFFLGSDKIVGDNLISRFRDEVQIPEAEKFYGFQIAMEDIHHEMYKLLLDEYIKDPNDKEKYLNGILTIQSIRDKANWAIGWMKSSKSFAERLLAFTIIEGIFFSGSFCIIFWFKKRGLLPGLTNSNEWISRDEGLHVDFACSLYKELNNRLSVKDVSLIIKEGVDIEKKFINEAFDVGLIGMNSKLMSQYIEYCADRLFYSLGYPGKIYDTQNPFEWMNMIGMTQKTNFFESRVSSYQKSNVGKDASGFMIIDDF
jgi:ribonucleoside-diphosphate reductase beta chain